MESCRTVNTIILKYFRYKEYELESKFSKAIAFARLNAVIETLVNTKSVGNIHIVVPDEEYGDACKYVNYDTRHIYDYSNINSIQELTSEKPLLFIDEQAFYVYEALLEKLICIAEKHQFVAWSDEDSLLNSFNYAASFYFFLAPGQYIADKILSHSGFYGLFQNVCNEKKAYLYPIEAVDIPGAYAKCVKYNPLPYHFAIEPTSYCDSKCIMCPFHSPDPEIAKGSVYLGDGGENMPLEKFKELIDEIDQLPWNYLPVYRHPQITVQLRGEPLLAPNFKEMCSYVKAKNMRLSFSTNGNNLHKNGMTDFLLDIGLDEIIVSIDPDEESFKQIRPQLNYSTVMDNIKRLYSERKKRWLAVPRILTKTVILRNSIEFDYRNIADRFSDISDLVGFAFENFEDFRTGTKNFSRYFSKIESLKRVPCLLVSDVVAIHSDGNVKLCYGNVETTIGNVFRTSVKDIIMNSHDRVTVLENNMIGDYDAIKECVPCTSWLAQYNVVKDEGEFKVYQNPILSYWQKKEPPIQAEKLESRLKNVFRKFGLLR